MRSLVTVLVASLLLCLSALSVRAEDLTIKPDDSVQTLLAAQKGKRVTLRLRSGQEFTGTVREVNAKLVVLAAPATRELFDAAVALDAVEAVLVRK